jgi:hypothetical protein
MTYDTTETPKATIQTSMNLLAFEKLTRFIRHIVKCSLAALKTAPIKPPRQPMQAKIGNSQILKFDASPLYIKEKRNKFD